MTANASGVIDPSVTERFFRAQYDLIFKNKLPISEIIVTPSSTGTHTIEYWGLLPFSRGSIHINSTDASAPASINPNYFMLDYDIQQQIATAKMARNFANTSPFSKAVSSETAPGPSAVPRNASDDGWGKWLKSTCKQSSLQQNKAGSKLTGAKHDRPIQFPLYFHSCHAPAGSRWRCRLQPYRLRHH